MSIIKLIQSNPMSNTISLKQGSAPVLVAPLWAIIILVFNKNKFDHRYFELSILRKTVTYKYF